MNRYWKQVASVFSGTALAQLIPILGSLIIARIFSPESFGEFSTWLASLSILSIIITLRLETSFVIIPDGEERNDAVFTTTLIMTALVIALLLSINMINLFKITDLPFVPIINTIIGAWFVAGNIIWQAWITADGKYTSLVKVRIVQSISILSGQIALGLYTPSMLSLSLGFMVGNLISLLYAYTQQPLLLTYSILSVKKLKAFIKRYKNFIIYGLPADAFNTSTAQLPIIIISYRFGAEVAGFLSLTTRILGMPIKLIGTAVLDVFKRYAAQEYIQKGNCKKIYIQTFIILFLASICLILGTIFLAKPIFSFAYGTDWEFSGTIAIWMLPMFALSFIASPLSYLVYIVEKQHIDLIWQITLFSITMTCLIIFNDFKESITYYSISYAILYLIYILISYNLSLGDKYKRI